MTDQEAIDKGYAEGKKSFEYLWQQILENFRWDNVYNTMKMLDWHWHTRDNEYGIPRVDTIQKHARLLCFDLWERGKGSISAGGLNASFFDNVLYLNFVIEYWATEN